ncbi:hypothetical protein XTPLMG730_0626 [Xanthomonas translucens pv. phlei]|uniref:Uncharacterized protein n=1 Tax=Xanthomonas graminis pv. phlei TaxID=487906 RepID=A0A0K2ZI89_9XANT|nr:hypothetical protein XTPLMG730_0626 [Xanthomonas translucens pv. phlei]
MWRHAVALLLLHVKFGLYGLNACFVETQEGLGQARLAMAQAGFFCRQNGCDAARFPGMWPGKYSDFSCRIYSEVV